VFLLIIAAINGRHFAERQPRVRRVKQNVLFGPRTST